MTPEKKKEYQREYMRKRREGISRGSEVGGEKSPDQVASEERAKEVHLDAVGLQQWSGPITGKVESGHYTDHPMIDTSKPMPEQLAPGKILPHTPPPIETQHTKTDMLFENKKPGYYIFEKDEIQKTCWYCGEGFRTRMKLNKFCCPDHKERWLIQSFRMGKE